MKILHLLYKGGLFLFRPFRANGLCFLMLFALTFLGEWLTLPATRGSHLYANLFWEVFADLYVWCVVLTLLPPKLRAALRRTGYVLCYSITLVDVYCFWKFQSTLTPTMLLLVGETDSREAGEFIRNFLSAEALTSPLSCILLLMLVHILLATRKRWYGYVQHARWMLWLSIFKAHISSRRLMSQVGWIALALFIIGAGCGIPNKRGLIRLLSGKNIGEVEHELTNHQHAVLYTAPWRLSFSIYANHLAAKQIDHLIAGIDNVRVDSCAFRSPTIVLIIGESYSRHHAALYGYPMPTTPRQQAREKTGLLVKFTDVVTPWNLTSFVFKNVFSLHTMGEPGDWSDAPLFPEVFRKAGYHVTFLTNQFLPKAKEAVYDFSGGFFLNNPILSAAQFDTRNTEVHRYDSGLLKDYDKIHEQGVLRQGQKGNLIIFHLLGQHVSYQSRYPANRTKFYASDYEQLRPELSARKRKAISQYDNAVLYNDSIVDQICQRFDKEEAIVIYMPDHGEECYEEQRGIVCRNHAAHIDYPLAKYEFEIPFWIYCSHPYAVRHPEIFREIVAAKERPYMLDAIPHLLLYLAGISSPDYREEYNILSDSYDMHRPRLLKGTANYDELRDDATQQE